MPARLARGGWGWVAAARAALSSCSSRCRPPPPLPQRGLPCPPACPWSCTPSCKRARTVRGVQQGCSCVCARGRVAIRLRHARCSRAHTRASKQASKQTHLKGMNSTPIMNGCSTSGTLQHARGGGAGWVGWVGRGRGAAAWRAFGLGNATSVSNRSPSPSGAPCSPQPLWRLVVLQQAAERALGGAAREGRDAGQGGRGGEGREGQAGAAAGREREPATKTQAHLSVPFSMCTYSFLDSPSGVFGVRSRISSRRACVQQARASGWAGGGGDARPPRSVPPSLLSPSAHAPCTPLPPTINPPTHAPTHLVVGAVAA